MPTVDRGCVTHHHACDCREDRMGRLEAVLTASRQAVCDDLAPREAYGANDEITEIVMTVGELRALREAVRAADTPPPTQRHQIDGDER